jgi:hypothetical protein
MNTDPNVPVVNVGSRQNPSYLPAEACVVEAGQPVNAKLTSSQTANMISFAVRSPGANADSIVGNGAQVLGMKPDLNATLVSDACTSAYDDTNKLGRVPSEPKCQPDYSSRSCPRGSSDFLQGSAKNQALKRRLEHAKYQIFPIRKSYTLDMA